MSEPLVTLKDEYGAERLVPLSQVEIPDLWGAYESLSKAAAWLQTDMMNPTKNHLVTERAKCIDAIATQVLAAWNLMHAMKKAKSALALKTLKEIAKKKAQTTVPIDAKDEVIVDGMVHKAKADERRRKLKKAARR